MKDTLENHERWSILYAKALKRHEWIAGRMRGALKRRLKQIEEAKRLGVKSFDSDTFLKKPRKK